jgi:hypothetical protein
LKKSIIDGILAVSVILAMCGTLSTGSRCVAIDVEVPQKERTIVGDGSPPKKRVSGEFHDSSDEKS